MMETRNKAREEIEVPKAFYNVQSVLDLPPPQGDNMKLLPRIFPAGLLQAGDEQGEVRTDT